MADFPSVAFFRHLADRMRARREAYQKLGPVDLTLIVRIRYPDDSTELFALAFDGLDCIVSQPGGVEDVHTPHPVIIEGAIEHWQEMVQNIRTHGAADLTHTLNYLTLPDWPLQLVAVDEDQGQLDVDRFYRYQANLQAFFDEAGESSARTAAA